MLRSPTVTMDQASQWAGILINSRILDLELSSDHSHWALQGNFVFGESVCARVSHLCISTPLSNRVAEHDTPVPKDDDSDYKDGNAEGQIAIHLPHNSLLVMHAEMQEEWKHSIAPAQAIDPHPIAGNKRINVTYRDYKSYLHPNLTPKCKCGVPTVLRVVQKRKENWGRYFWQCHTSYVPDKEGCSFFQWAEFDDDGKPIWDKITSTSHSSQVPRKATRHQE